MKYFFGSITSIFFVNIFLFLCVTSTLISGCVSKKVELLDEDVLITKCNNLYNEKSYDEAFHYCKQSAELGWQAAQKNTGWMYSNGKGVEQDYTQAFHWYEKAAIQGNSCAQNNLGLAYYRGNGIEKNNKKAVKWLRKSAAQGNLYGLTMLGSLYIKGDGVPKHQTMGFAYILVASEREHNTAIKYKEFMLENFKLPEEFLRKSRIIANKIVQEIGDKDHCNV